MVDLTRYIPPNLRGPLREARGLGYSILDNVIGLGDGFESGGERLGTAIRENPIGTAKAVGGSILEGVGEAVTDPVGTVKDMGASIAQSYQRGSQGAAAYLPEGVSLKDATYAQIREANDAYLADLTNLASVVPAVKGAGSVVRAADDAIGADTIGLLRAVSQGDLEGIGEVFQRGGEAQSLSAAKGPKKEDLDPLGYQKTKLRDYLKNTDVQRVDLGEKRPRTPRTWEEMENKLVMPFYGDRTSGGELITGVNDIKFDKPVYTEAGLDFMRGKANLLDDAIWASNSNIITRIDKEAQKAREKFGESDIFGMTGSMAPDANDFAQHTGSSISEMVQQSKITRAGAAEFNDIMRSIDPSFVGLRSPKLRDWLDASSSPIRKTFIRLMDSAPMQAAGLPSPAIGRLSVTDPTQVDLPAGQFGMGVAKIDEFKPILKSGMEGNRGQQVPHSTYNTQITGEYFGSLPPVPQSLIFTDVYDAMEGKTTKAGLPLSEAHKTHAIKTKMPVERMTSQKIEGILNYLARLGK
jgi:hypothetical protein